MTESWLSTTIIFAELGGVLLLVLAAGIVFYIFRLKRDGKQTKELISHVKNKLANHKNKLSDHFKDEMNLEDNKANSNVKSLIDNERKLYERLVSVAINKDTKNLKLTVDDINTLLNDYVRLLTLKGNVVADQQRDARELQLRKENEALRAKLAEVEAKLKLATDSVENMMAEYATMYEGGKKEGEQRVKNEMYKLKQSMENEKVKATQAINELDQTEE